MRRDIVDSQLAAYHEASHAVIGLWLRRKVRRVEIDPLRPGNGQVLFERWSLLDIEPKDKTSALLVWNHALSNAKGQAKILLAGPLAEAKLLRTPLRSLGSRSDLESTLEILHFLEDVRGRLSNFTEIGSDYSRNFNERLRRQTRRLIGVPKIWRAICLLADDLLVWHELEGDEIATTVQWAFDAEGQTHLLLDRESP